jgi:hypothetical protein
MMTFLLLLIPVLLQTTLSSHAFIVIVNDVKSSSPPSPSLLLSAAHAASSKKKKRAAGGRSTSNSGEGFGSSSSTTISHEGGGGGNDNNIIVYPELDLNIVKTLIPYTTTQNHQGGDDRGGGGGNILPMDMYDRLDEIYGFDKFNFGGTNSIYKSIGTTTTTTTTTSDVNTRAASSFLDDRLLSDGHHSSPSSSSSFDLNTLPPFKQFRILHTDPMVLAIDDFFTMDECDKYVQLSIDSETLQQEEDGRQQQQQQQHQTSYSVDNDDDDNKKNMIFQPMILGQSRTIGTDSYSRAQRTSTTWFHHYGGVPELIAKASRLLGLESINRWEEPQTVRYRKNEQFTWHLDALSPTTLINNNNKSSTNVVDDDGAGQRIATLLVYLTNLSEEDGGATMFRDLGGISNNGVRNPLKV